MRKLLSVGYGLAAYVASLATMLYLVGFSGDLVGPAPTGTGAATTPWGEALAIDLLLVAAFGVQHSVMARRGFKSRWTRIVPASVERSTYLLATCAVLALLFALWVPIDAPVVWRIEQRAVVALLWGLFALGWLVALLSTFLIDHLELFGLRQVFALAAERDAPEAHFRTPLLYRHVRHPLYAGLLLAFWSVPVMTAGRLVFALGFTAYVLIGIAFEERDLLRQFGERYRAYREQVGMLVPRRRSARLIDASGAAGPATLAPVEAEFRPEEARAIPR